MTRPTPSAVSGTPTFFINGRRHYGAYDVDTLSAAVKAARARAAVVEPAPLDLGGEPTWLRVLSSSGQPEEEQMIVMFTARRLKPGAWEQFRQAWAPGDDEYPPGFVRAYHARNIRDEDEVISFGLFDMSKDDYHRWRGEADAEENQRVDRLSAFVQNEYVSGVYEVIDQVEP